MCINSLFLEPWTTSLGFLKGQKESREEQRATLSLNGLQLGNLSELTWETLSQRPMKKCSTLQFWDLFLPTLAQAGNCFFFFFLIASFHHRFSHPSSRSCFEPSEPPSHQILPLHLLQVSPGIPGMPIALHIGVQFIPSVSSLLFHSSHHSVESLLSSQKWKNNLDQPSQRDHSQRDSPFTLLGLVSSQSPAPRA